MFSCSFCSKSFKNRISLNAHLLSHTREKPHKCHICTATFGHKSNLHQHVKSVHDGIKVIRKRTTQCPFCAVTKCDSKTALERHLRKHTTEQPFCCSEPSCGFKTKYKKSLQQHFRHIHSAERPFECPLDGCTYKTKVNRSLEKHLKLHSSMKMCKVPGCSYTCKGFRNLKGHYCTSEEKPWKCSVCDFRSKQKSNLKTHEDTHKNVRRFQCQARNCNFSSSQKCNLDLHLDRKHTKTKLRRIIVDEVKIFHCRLPDCGYQTKLSHHYDRHIATHNKKEKRNHVCTFCFSRFTNLRFLKNHLQRHVGEKPYRCSHCEYAAVSNAELRLHARRVHHIYVNSNVKEDQVRKCRTCNESFWCYNELMLHSMRHLQTFVVLERLKLKAM